MLRSFLLSVFIFSFCFSFSQAPKTYSSGEIYQAIQKLNFLGSVLYIAAHPDDENTLLISYLSNESKAHTTYLSITRGDGGQNLLGTEISELLGVIRTQELLAARRIDGGNQHFTRATDFGYSKNPEETLATWNKEEVLSDVVWAIRKLQPDVIINRFDHRTPGRTHGHHTSSAILSLEAFGISDNPERYPEQLKYVEPWSPRRIFMNTGWWFYGSRENFEKADKSNMLSIDIGTYYPILGKSNGEIAAASRSMHKCQGFGATASRGESMEYLELLNGDMPTDHSNIFGGINTSWTRVKGGAPIGRLLTGVIKDFDFEHPSASIPKLMEVNNLIRKLPEGKWKTLKSKEIVSIIENSLGLFTEAVTRQYYCHPGESIPVSLEITNRSSAVVKLKSMTFLPVYRDTVVEMLLAPNIDNHFRTNISIPSSISYTNPYWLNAEADLGMYTVKDQKLRGVPETPRPLQVRFSFELEGTEFNVDKNLIYNITDPVKGEYYRPLEIIPKVTLDIQDEVYLFSSAQGKEIEVTVNSNGDDIVGTLFLQLEDGWSSSPENYQFELTDKGSSKSYTFQIIPPDFQSVSQVQAIARVDGKSYRQSMIEINYDHIPVQTVLKEARAKVVHINLETIGKKIAYIPGAGDKVPESLEQIGYQVDLLEVETLSKDQLLDYDACIVGIRAYNTQDMLKFKQNELLEYVKNGGTLILQYNTSRGLNIENLGPYPLQISRDRVSEENAEVRFLIPDHPVLNYPNKITDEDFDGWVQERGLYFAGEWDENQYEAILSCNDQGEEAKKGALLIANYGEGHYIYTGLSWFRQLPAGVPGAYRLFANLISIGKLPRP